MPSSRAYHTVGFVVTVALLPALLAACQTGGGKSGDSDLVAGDVVLGRVAYSGKCYDCHGTPGQNDGDAPQLAGTSAAALEQRFAGGEHEGVSSDDLDRQTYLDLEAYLGADTGLPGSGDLPCAAMPDQRLADYRDALETDQENGTSREDAVAGVASLCQVQMLLEDGALVQNCVDCLGETIDELYPEG
jgi:mono/diheme cytochrome c family protein